MIYESVYFNRPNKKDGYYTGDLTDEQIHQMNVIYERGGVKALENVLNGYQLKDYQTMLATLAYISKSFLVGADTGLGKSLIMSLYLKIHQAKGTLGGDKNKALVVTTTASLEQIRTVIEDSTGIRVFAISGNAKELQKQLARKDFDQYDIYVVANSVFSKSVEFNRMFAFFVNQFNIFILDESMVSASDNSIVSEALKGWVQHFEYKMLLNATVIEKSLEQAVNQLKLLYPDLLEPLPNLMSTYSYKHDGKIMYRNLDKFFDKLRYYFCNVDRQHIGASFKYEDILVPLHMTALQRQVQTSKNYWYALFSPTTQSDTSVIPFNREELPYLNSVISILDDELNSHDGGVVIFVEPTACKPLLKNVIEQALPGTSVDIIDGSEIEFRSYKVKAFNEGRTRVLITNIPEALDLWRGMAMIFLTIPSKHYQARGRIARGLDTDGPPLKYYYPIYLNSKQLDYIKDTLTLDEKTITGALSRHIETSRNLMKKIKQLTQ